MEEGLVFKKTKGTRRARASGGGGDGEGDEGAADEVSAVAVKRRAQRGLSAASHESSQQQQQQETVAYSASGAQLQGNRAVTAMAEAKEEQKEAAGLQQEVDGEKVYRGSSEYASFRKAKEGAKGTTGGGLRAGPVKASGFIRSTTLIDYQPNVCKDYKQTGYCGFGHNCKYLHDRGDYKSGWEIDKDWEARQKAGGAEENYEIHSSEDDGDDLPFACFICREEFKNPVVTKCGHYFCEDCALKQEKKTRKCFICNEPTMGIFNQPTALIAKLKAKKKKEQEEEQQGGEDE